MVSRYISGVAAEGPAMHESVQASINYLVPTGRKPCITLAPGRYAPPENTAYQGYLTTIRNARRSSHGSTLEREGFLLLRHATAAADLFDETQIRTVYYPEMERLVKCRTGASMVVAFHHFVRVNDRAVQAARKADGPVQIAHCDYTEDRAYVAAKNVLDAIMAPERTEAMLRHRFAVVQLWQPIAGPVRDMPLAVCDARSIAPRDIIKTDLAFEGRHVAEVIQLGHNPDHRWYYFHEMEADEILIFKGHDSLDDGRARFTAHTAFANPLSPPGAPPRQSIEVRALAFFAPR